MEIKHERKGEELVVTIQGDVDINSAPKLKATLDQLLTLGATKLTLDLAGVPYMDSSGLATCVELVQRLKAKGGTLTLTRLTPKVKGLFEITKLEQLFTIQ